MVNLALNTSFNKIKGQFELIDQSLNVCGWALNTDSIELPEINIAIGDTIVATGRCTFARPDLISLNISKRHSGFKIAIPGNRIKRLINVIHVLANNEILPGSPIVLDLTSLVSIKLSGQKNGMLQISVSGWPGASIKGQVKIDGNPAGYVKIIRQKNTHDEIKISWSIPETFQDSKLHTYSVEIDHDNAIVRSDVDIFSFPEYGVYIDHADEAGLQGWVTKVDMAAPVKINAIYKDKIVASAYNDIIRDDVSAAIKVVSNRVGFKISFDTPIYDSNAEILIRDSDTGIDIASVNIFTSYSRLHNAAIAFARQEVDRATSSTASIFTSLMNSATGETEFSWQELQFNNTKSTENAVCIIIPVYGGALEVTECLESILISRNNAKYRIIIVNDNSPDAVIVDYLQSLERRGVENLSVINRTQNGGFSASVNIGIIAAQSSDVILLNADTVVPDHWLDRLLMAARSDARIGTVTTLSNNGEICSLPYMCKSTAIDSPDFAQQLDTIAEKTNSRLVIDIPVAVGFCMFIKRDCLNDVGPFDAAKWGRGYGEEVDFCMKASNGGWRHVLAADIFIVHRGAVSFGDEKFERIIESAKKISADYPFYDQAIQIFIKADPVSSARRAINLELLNTQLDDKRVLHICHGLGGGTKKYIDDISELYRQDGFVNCSLSVDITKGSTLSVDSTSFAHDQFFLAQHQETFRPDELEELKSYITEFKFSRVHIHSPLGMSLEFLTWLTTSHDYYITVHDYAWICPRVTLTTSSGLFYDTSQDYASGAQNALNYPYRGMEDFVRLAEGDINIFKKNFASIFGHAEIVFAPADDVVQRLEKHGLNARYKSIAHPVLEDSVMANHQPVNTQLRPGERVRVALFGGISAIKGYFKLLECASYAQQNNLPIDFIVFGYTQDNSRFAQLSNVNILGPYDESDLENLVQSYRPHLSFFPNQLAETFSYTLSHAFGLGLWPIVTNLGAPAERVFKSKYGSVLSYTFTPYEACALILNTAHNLAGSKPQLPCANATSFQFYFSGTL